VLDTRALSRRDEIVTQWRVKWQNLNDDQATWGDKFLIKASFPEFLKVLLVGKSPLKRGVIVRG
jgi:hypothetical protein